MRDQVMSSDNRPMGGSSTSKKIEGEFKYHVESMFMGRSKILVNEAIWSKIPVIK